MKVGSRGASSGIMSAKGRLKETGGQGIIDASGALNDKNDPDGSNRDRFAREYYETQRNSKPEFKVAKLSKHGGISLKSAQKVFEHVFINKYELDGGRKRFDPSYDMAQSFQRLLSGKNIQAHDMILLRHERLEYELMKRYKKDYDRAHELASRKYDYGRSVEEWRKGRRK